MAYELWNVMGVAALVFLMSLIQVLIGMAEFGLPRLFSARDDMPAAKGKLLGRATRAQANLVTHIAWFLPLVFIAFAADRFGPATELGTALFLWARVAHFILYMAGIPVLRTLSWLAAVVGCGFIVAGIIG